jgi:hypothetical protein
MSVPTATAKTVAIHMVETGTPRFCVISVPLPGAYIAQPPVGTVDLFGAAGRMPSLSFDAEWLNVVEQRIISSTPAEGYPTKGNTAWLQPQVGRAALDFFKQTSTALPGEPYIYSSEAGELVAEFAALRGKMTCIISPDFVLVFVATDSEIIERKFLPNREGANTLRSDIQKMTAVLNSGKNGALGSKA